MTHGLPEGAEVVPGDLAAQYYAQRASAGLIISEAAQISAQGKGYPGAPGIYSGAQVAGWQKVTKAVHAEGLPVAPPTRSKPRPLDSLGSKCMGQMVTCSTSFCTADQTSARINVVVPLRTERVYC